MTNPYIDQNRIDRTPQIDAAFKPTMEDIKADPAFYAELVNDLLYHWIYGTRETKLMIIARDNVMIGNGDLHRPVKTEKGWRMDLPAMK